MKPDYALKGSDLLTPQPKLNLPPPTLVQTPASFVAGSVSPYIKTGDDYMAEQKAIYDKQKEATNSVFSQLQAVGSDNAPSFSDTFDDTLKSYGTPKAVSDLRDVQTELNGLNTQFDVQNVQIAEGNSIGQGQREVTQNDRERAVRTAGLAAKAQILQGNITTAQSIARDATNFAFQDRQAKLTNLSAQLSYLSGQEGLTDSKLVTERKRVLDEKQAELDNVRNNVAAAIAAGANPAEVDFLTDPKTTDEDRLALAQRVQARVAGEDRSLDRAQKYASIAASNTSRLLALAEAGDKTAIAKLGFNPNDVKEELDPTTKRQVSDKLEAGKNLVTLATQYKKLVEDHGFESTAYGSQEVVGQFQALRSQITAAYKDAKQLGTLDAGVMKLMDGIIGEEPTSGFFNPAANFFGGRSNRIENQLQELIEATTNENAQNMLRLGLNPQEVDFSVLSDEDNAAVDAAFGVSQTTPAAAFDPSNYFKK